MKSTNCHKVSIVVANKYSVSKNDSVVALYNFNAYQPIFVAFGRYVTAGLF